MSKKLTKRDHFNTLLTLSEVQKNELLVEFIEHEIELLERKNSSEKKPTAQQTANEGIKAAILEGMEKGRLSTITEIIKDQRVSALIRQMYDCADPVIERVEDKRKAYFRKISD